MPFRANGFGAAAVTLERNQHPVFRESCSRNQQFLRSVGPRAAESRYKETHPGRLCFAGDCPEAGGMEGFLGANGFGAAAVTLERNQHPVFGI